MTGRDDAQRLLPEMYRESFSSRGERPAHAAAGEMIPRSHWDFFENCLDWHVTDEYIFVHGGVNPDLDLEQQSLHELRWTRFHRSQRPHRSGKKVICGHTPRYDGRSVDIGHAVCIDTYLYGGKWLTCMDVRRGRYYQANNLGETRIIA